MYTLYFHVALLPQKHIDLLKEKGMYCTILPVLGTHPSRWSVAGFCANSPEPSFERPHLPMPCSCWGLFSPRPGPFRLISELSYQSDSFPFFLRPWARLSEGQSALSLPAQAPGLGHPGQSRWCRVQALERRRSEPESQVPTDSIL